MSGSTSGSGTLPSSLHAETRGEIAILRLNRAEKRNALNDETVLGIETFFNHLPKSVKAVVLHGDGDHFSAGLDLSNLRSHSIEEAVRHSGIACSTRSSLARYRWSR
jgi:(methylthio)acryloyl-CoA hydratase